MHAPQFVEWNIMNRCFPYITTHKIKILSLYEVIHQMKLVFSMIIIIYFKYKLSIYSISSVLLTQVHVGSRLLCKCCF